MKALISAGRSPGSQRAVSLIIGILLIMNAPFPASGQVLNEEIARLLEGGCPGLGSPIDQADGFGPNLISKICNPPLSTPGVAANGVASVQGSTASVLNRALLGGRLVEVKDEREGRGEASLMRFNPFGLLAMTSGRNFNINSPFYAASTGEGSTGSFYASSPSRWKGFGFFSAGRVESLNREITRFENGYKSTILGISAGVDYRFSKNLVAGLLGNYANTDGEFRGGGTFSTNSYGFLTFAQVLPTEKTFIQVNAGYTRNNYLVLREANLDFRGDNPDFPTKVPEGSNSNGDVASTGVLTGYDHSFGRFIIGPRAGVYYTHTHIGNYRENGNSGTSLAYDDQHIDSLQTIFGLFGSTAYSTRVGVLVHQVSADYVHEFMNHQRRINVQFAEDLRGTPAFPGTAPTRFTFQNERPARDYANLGTGFVMVWPNGWQSFVNFLAMVGNEHFNNYAGTFGLRLVL